MRSHVIIFAFSLFFLKISVFAQAGQTSRLFIPFFDEQCQSNVDVTVSDLFGSGQPCPMKYTNTLSNTNLFTPEEQRLVNEAFVKYKTVTTNSGPPGTVLAGFYKTNFVVHAMGRAIKIENYVARFHYTNFDAHETIMFGAGIFAEFRTKSTDGYNVSISRVGDGSAFRFTEIRHNLINGVVVEFDDTYAQGTTWDYKLAHFDGSHLDEYGQYSAGMTIGKYFMWNPRNGNLMLEAEFKDPCDFQKNRVNPFQP